MCLFSHSVHVPPDSELTPGLRVVVSTLAAADVILIHSPLTKWKSSWHSHCGFSPWLLTRHLSFLPHCTLPSVDASHSFKCVPLSLSEKNRRQYIKDEWIRWGGVDPRAAPAFLAWKLTDNPELRFYTCSCTYLKRINKIRTLFRDIFNIINLTIYEKLQNLKKWLYL